MAEFPAKVRKLIHIRADYCCERCGRAIVDGVPRSVHHRLPRGMGGSKRPEVSAASNGIYLCGSATTPEGCHHWVESNRADAQLLGFLVPRWASPLEVPVSLMGASGVPELVYLDDDGNYIPTEGAA